jgi:hypothetical protein
MRRPPPITAALVLIGLDPVHCAATQSVQVYKVQDLGAAGVGVYNCVSIIHRVSEVDPPVARNPWVLCHTRGKQ